MEEQKEQFGEGMVTGYGSDYLFHQDVMDEELPSDVGFLLDIENNEITVHGKKMPYDMYLKIITGQPS